ncbi:MAG: class I SAM-dependent RNA methyltransferase [Simkaniaceae bacterium]|nr:MAG: class I SAM-dependent RNA methyltransferase [Simkaniaceae bacterium]
MSKTSKSNHIEKIIFGGNGLTRIDGCVTFVPFSAPGDEATLKITQKKKHYLTASIETLIKKGAERVQPKCPHYKTCAGCQLQHLSYKGQLEAKQGFIQEALRIHNVSITPSPLQWNYRSHIRLNLAQEKEGFKMGYIGWDNRSMIEPTICPLFLEDPSFFTLLKDSLLILPNKGIKSASMRIFKQEDKIYLAFSTFPQLPKSLIKFPFAEGTSYKSPGKEKQLGIFPFSPYGFMQSNAPVTEKIYQTIADWVGPEPKRILDLYCGVGITSSLLAKGGHEVIGIEANRALLPSSKEVQFICSKVESALPKLLKTFRPDLILVNPPRTGLSKEVPPLLQAETILYLSCMPSTLARDIERLNDRYSIESVEAFDMFPQTTHVETLLKLRKNSS